MRTFASPDASFERSIVPALPSRTVPEEKTGGAGAVDPSAVDARAIITVLPAVLTLSPACVNATTPPSVVARTNPPPTAPPAPLVLNAVTGATDAHACTSDGTIV